MLWIVAFRSAKVAASSASPLATFIPWLLQEKEELSALPLSEVIFHATGKKVLAIDPERVTSEVRYEAPAPPAPPDSPLAGVMFPHIYGPLNRDAIVEVRSAMRSADGTFLTI